MVWRRQKSTFNHLFKGFEAYIALIGGTNFLNIFVKDQATAKKGGLHMKHNKVNLSWLTSRRFDDQRLQGWLSRIK